jgi:hypothetical protein
MVFGAEEEKMTAGLEIAADRQKAEVVIPAGFRRSSRDAERTIAFRSKNRKHI